MLPRLLVVTDVPVTDTVAGSLQLYRLLGGYPPDRLCICEGGINARGRLRGRLPGVRHVTVDSGSARWRRSRLVRMQGALLMLAMPSRASRIADAITDFRPEAVLTVAQEFVCFAAEAFARRSGLPLHLIIHDDWLMYARLPAWFVPYARRQFGRLYAGATERWCISPSMEEHYRGQWGVAGQVLLPVCGEEYSKQPPEGVSIARKTTTIAYAGSVSTGGRAKLLLQFAKAIDDDGHRLALMVPGGLAAVRAQARKVGCLMNPENVDDLGYAPPGEIVSVLRAHADALLVAETFDPLHHDSVAYNFPSKLSDYCAAGLPIIVWAPPYSTAARWARENPEAAILIDNEDLGPVRVAVGRLVSAPVIRQRMAVAVAAAAPGQFDPRAARGRLYDTIADSVATRRHE